LPETVIKFIHLGWNKFYELHKVAMVGAVPKVLPRISRAGFLSRMNVSGEFFTSRAPRITKALADMAALEKGAIANPAENRILGRYYLRNPASAPSPEIRWEIEETTSRIKDFAGKIHAGEIRGKGGAFKNCLLIGISDVGLGGREN
jgi:glucose-6-phosphate isomerase